jgi:uncharacterized protein
MAVLAVLAVLVCHSFFAHATGLRPAGTALLQPSRARMALFVIVVVYGPVLSIETAINTVLRIAPAPLRLLIAITIEVFAMTYIIMPRLSRLLAWWIYPTKVHITHV